MYETFFGLSRRPFSVAPQVEQYVPNQHSEQALQTLSRSIERGEGPGLVIGATGTGKSFLLEMLAVRYADRFRIAYLASARFNTPRALLQNILYELGRPYKGLEEAECRLALTEFLLDDDHDSRPLLLLIDEAHALSLRLLEELRMVTNLVRGGQPAVRLVLAGNARLEERFTSPKLDSFNQRIAARCYLESLNREDTIQYVQQHLARAGGKLKQLVTDDACRAIYTATDGVPRLINQVCDQALLLAAVAQRSPLDAQCVEEAWADLQQLPTPFHHQQPARTGPAVQESGPVVEFGSLCDDAPSRPVPAASPAEARAIPTAAAKPVQPAITQSTAGDALFSYDTHRAGEATMDLEQLHRSLTQLQSEVSQATVTQGQGDFEFGEPQVNLDSYDDDFQPAGFVGPEVELVFHGPHNPFGETFEEEEVVIDHYASLEKISTERRVHDSSGQSNEIAAVLAGPAREVPAVPAAETGPARPSLALVTEADDDLAGPEPAVARQAAIDLPAVTSEWEAAHAEPILPAHDDDQLPLVASHFDGESADDSDTEFAEELLAADDDRDIIIIDDQHGSNSAVATMPASRVRRQEYRQLFARLRRGS